MSVGFAALLLTRLSGFQCSLKPGFGTAILFAVVRIISLTRFTLTAFSVFAEMVVRITAGLLTLDVALFATGLLTLDVALFATGLLTLDVALFATGLLTVTVGTVLGAVGRRVSGFVADSAVLIQERWADDFSLGSGLVLDEMIGVFLFGTSRITTNFAEWLDSDGVGRGGSISGRRHCIRLYCF
jgi:hypothetical protein